MSKDIQDLFGEASNDPAYDDQAEIEARRAAYSETWNRLYLTLGRYKGEGYDLPTDPKQLDAYCEAVDRGQRRHRRMKSAEREAIEKQFGLDRFSGSVPFLNRPTVPGPFETPER